MDQQKAVGEEHQQRRQKYIRKSSMLIKRKLCKAGAAKEKHTGFVAQEVEKAANELKYDFGAIDKPKNNKDLYGLRYSEFVVPLVKAVQELSAENEDLKKEVGDLQTRLSKLESIMSDNNSNTTSVNLSSAYLQSVPNPSNGNATIRYYIPSNVNNAKVVITDSKGSLIKTIALNSRGAGQINLNGATLFSGTYNYSLWLDNLQVNTKQMVITK
jgi:uncharacterized protein YlxW (UPF0749 family)